MNQRTKHASGIALMLLAITFFIAASSSRSGGAGGVEDAPVDEGIAIRSNQSPEKHEFRFDARSLKHKPTSVNLAGTFNHWSHDDTPMADEGGGVYTVTLELAPGLYQYKYLVDGEQWFNDPTADKELDDKNDHDNSGVIIGLDARTLPQVRPDFIEPRAIAHDPASEIDANVASTTLLRLRLSAQAGNVQSVQVWFRTPENPQWQQGNLWSVDQHLGFEIFGGTINPNGKSAEYFFELIDGQAKRYLADSRLYESLDTAKQHPYVRSMTPLFTTPDWAKHAVWYQIFAERFRNGDPSNDPPGTQRWQAKWYDTLPGEQPGADKYYTVNAGRRRFGGDIQGMRDELPYLHKLGITAIYLNPMFQADSAHKYDTRDYRHIDDFFGVKDSAAELVGETEDPATWKWSKSDLLFLDFLHDAHQQGIKVIVDGVFNHVGKSNPFFQDVLKNGKSSKYADWFVILDWGNGGPVGKPGGLQYQSWNGRNGALPIFRKNKETGIVHGPREHLFAITRRWLAPDGDVSRGVDGFRLDAANEIPHVFWIDWRKLVKSINPDAYIDGEIWSWAQPWLGGDQFDAVMNYQFAMASQSFFVDRKTALKPTEFGRRLDSLFYNYPLQVVLAQQNLFDSHDTDRFASRFRNPDIGYNRHNRLQEAGSKYDASQPGENDWARDRQAVAFQMCFAGAPMIYYGDEAGMWGPSDPSDRMPMWWKDLEPFDDPECKFNQPLFDWYQRCIAIRQALPQLQVGSYRTVLADDANGQFCFARELSGQSVYVVLNRSDSKAEITLPVNDVASGKSLVNKMNETGEKIAVENGYCKVELDAYGVAVLSPE
jgi:cyclomaltodextrinase / maltogenic alpha-amylase / neopullulanase